MNGPGAPAPPPPKALFCWRAKWGKASLDLLSLARLNGPSQSGLWRAEFARENGVNLLSHPPIPAAVRCLLSSSGPPFVPCRRLQHSQFEPAGHSRRCTSIGQPRQPRGRESDAWRREKWRGSTHGLIARAVEQQPLLEGSFSGSALFGYHRFGSPRFHFLDVNLSSTGTARGLTFLLGKQRRY